MKVIPFDTAEHLDCPETIANYLYFVITNGDEKELKIALDDACRALHLYYKKVTQLGDF